MYVFSLPYLIGERFEVHQELAEQETPADLTGEQVVIVSLCAAASTRALDELVAELVERRNAAELHVVGPRDQILYDLYDAVVRRRLADRVTFHEAPIAEHFPFNRRSASRAETSRVNAACSAAAAAASRATA